MTLGRARAGHRRVLKQWFLGAETIWKERQNDWISEAARDCRRICDGRADAAFCIGAAWAALVARQ